MAGWIVTVNGYPYGPFDDHEEAQLFAGFLTAEVDPAKVARLRSPVGELLSWHGMVKDDPDMARAEDAGGAS